MSSNLGSGREETTDDRCRCGLFWNIKGENEGLRMRAFVRIKNEMNNTEQDKSECGLSRMLDILYSKFCAATVLSSTEVKNKASLRGCSVDKPY